MRSLFYKFQRWFTSHNVNRRSPSILLYLTLQVIGIVVVALIGINLWTIAQMHQQMAATDSPQSNALWHIGLSSSMVAMAVILPVMIIAIAITVRRSLKPLKQLTRSLAHPTLEPSYQAVIVPALPSEVQSLARTYNELLETLSEVGTQQQQFIGSLSHELRTSLSLISGYLQHISRRSANLTENQQEALEIATAETERMVQLLQDSLELARVESHSLPFHPESLILNEVVADVVRMTQTSQHCDIQVETVMPRIFVYADRDRLLQVLIHLIENAIRRSENQPMITLKLDAVGNSARIQVCDRGFGIAVSQIAETPITLSEIRAKERIDLGLVIVDTLVKRMGGSVTVQSFAGQGNNFWIMLPAG